MNIYLFNLETDQNETMLSEDLAIYFEESDLVNRETEYSEGNEEDINYLMKNIKSIAKREGNKIIFSFENIYSFFQEDFNKLKEAVNNLTIEEFCSDINKILNIKEIIKEYENIYISFSEWGGYGTIWDFVRYIYKNNITEFYIGGIVEFYN